VTVQVFYDPRRVEQLRQQGITGRRQLGGVTVGVAVRAPNSPPTVLEAIEESARLRAENRRLVDEVERLRREVERLRGAGQPADALSSGEDPDDSAQRFSLLKLDL
jgi:hypothetical protein